MLCYIGMLCCLCVLLTQEVTREANSEDLGYGECMFLLKLSTCTFSIFSYKVMVIVSSYSIRGCAREVQIEGSEAIGGGRRGAPAGASRAGRRFSFAMAIRSAIPYSSQC